MGKGCLLALLNLSGYFITVKRLFGPSFIHVGLCLSLILCGPCPFRGDLGLDAQQGFGSQNDLDKALVLLHPWDSRIRLFL